MFCESVKRLQTLAYVSKRLMYESRSGFPYTFATVNETPHGLTAAALLPHTHPLTSLIPPVMFNNHVTLTGHLGARPETRVTASGHTLATVRIAVSKSYKDNHGNFVKDTQWFRLTAWGRVGEQMTERLTVGDRVCVSGRLSCRTYETKDGQRRESVEVVVSEFERLRRFSERRALAEHVADAEPDRAAATADHVEQPALTTVEEALPF